jgi:hypothetical protein
MNFGNPKKVKNDTLIYLPEIANLNNRCFPIRKHQYIFCLNISVINLYTFFNRMIMHVCNRRAYLLGPLKFCFQGYFTLVLFQVFICVTVSGSLQNNVIKLVIGIVTVHVDYICVGTILPEVRKYFDFTLESFMGRVIRSFESFYSNLCAQICTLVNCCICARPKCLIGVHCDELWLNCKSYDVFLT